MGVKTLNGAGASAADPILKGLPFAVVGACSSVDVVQVNSLALDPATGAVTNDLKANAVPASTVVTAGTDGVYTDATGVHTASSTAGWAVGGYVFLSHASITDGIYKIAVIPDGTSFTVEGDPLNGAGDQSNVIYQVAWSIPAATVETNVSSSVGGSNNFAKILAEDAGAIETTQEDNFYVRDAPAGSAIIAIEGVNYTGQTSSDFSHTLSILPGWANRGGISYVALGDHSTQGVNNWAWTTGGGVGEKTLADAELSGITAAAGDGIKYGSIQLLSKSGGTPLSFDISMTVDSTGPTLTLTLVAE